MEQIPWYQSAIVRQQIVMVILGILGLLKINSTIDIDATVTAVLAGIAALVPVWTIITRFTKAHPPLTAKAAAKEGEVQAQLTAKKQGGYASLLLLASLALISGTVLLGLSGCAGTTAAYKAAQGVDQQAYVALEHYDALVKEGIALKSKPGVPPEVITAIKKADAAVFPVIQRVKSARDVYARVKNAPNEEALQLAVNDAVLLLADLINAIKEARGAP